MTDPQLALELPGLEDDRAQDGAMVKAARQSIREWATAGKLLPHHAVLTQLMLSLAASIDGGARAGRASAVAMAAAQLREVVMQIDPPPTEEGAGSQALGLLREFMGQLPQPAPAPELPAAVVPGEVQR